MAKVIKYGVVGFSKNQFDKTTARRLLEDLFQKIKEKHEEAAIEIVSGYTNSGVPKLAYELADKYGFTTIGFSAKQALSVKSGVYPVSKVILIGEKFGDESEDFVKYIDALIRIGGGQQSRRETTLFKELNKGKALDTVLKEYEVDWYGKD
jgi:phosphoribosyl-ATP pyrophosphohydrolase